MSYFETNLAPANSYYRVLKSFDVLVATGTRPTNYYFGSSQICEPVYETLRVKRGGRILNLVGGLFYAERPGAACRPVVLAKNAKSPFEKRYSPDKHQWPLDKLAPCEPVAFVR